MLARHFAAVVAVAAILNATTPVGAQDTIKIGFVAEFSGIRAE